MGKRIYSLQAIRYWFCYDVEEVCAMYKRYSLHPQTVRQWIKDGLPTIDQRKPTLIYGAELKAFLGKMNSAHKCQTAFDQMFCLKCRDAKTPYQKRVQLEQTKNYVKAKAHCLSCKTIMNKTYKMDDVPKLRFIFRVGDLLELDDSNICPVKTHIHACEEKQSSEPRQLELFDYVT